MESSSLVVILLIGMAIYLFYQVIIVEGKRIGDRASRRAKKKPKKPVTPKPSAAKARRTKKPAQPESTRATKRPVDQGTKPAHPQQKKDDLSRIEGIGSKIAQLLTSAGSTAKARGTKKAAQPESTVATKRPVAQDTEPAHPQQKDDLTRSEGIGTKIAQLLTSAGSTAKARGTKKAAQPESTRATKRPVDPGTKPAHPQQKKDDLTRIEVIGSKIAQLLTSVGTTAKARGTKKPAQPESTPATKRPVDQGTEPAHPQQKDDLTRIEGIETKVAQLLTKAGITTYEQLAASDMATLEAAVTAGGIKFRQSVAETWPEQARFAHNEQWEPLNAIQAKLKGRRTRKG